MMKEQDIYFPKWIEIIVELNKNPNMTTIAYNMKITHSSVGSIVRVFETKGYCVKVKKGRNQLVELTDKGKKISMICETLMSNL